MGCFATGVTIVTLDLEGDVHGMTADAFASVSLDHRCCWLRGPQRATLNAHMHAQEALRHRYSGGASAGYFRILRIRCTPRGTPKQTPQPALTTLRGNSDLHGRWPTWMQAAVGPGSGRSTLSPLPILRMSSFAKANALPTIFSG